MDGLGSFRVWEVIRQDLPWRPLDWAVLPVGCGCWRGAPPLTVTAPVSVCALPSRRGSSPLTPLPSLCLLFSGNCPPVGESQSPSGQPSAPAPPPRLNPSASSPHFFKYLRHNPSGEQSGSAVPKRWAAGVARRSPQDGHEPGSPVPLASAAHPAQHLPPFQPLPDWHPS